MGKEKEVVKEVAATAIETPQESVVYNYCYDDKFQAEDIENRRLYLNCEIDENAIDNIVWFIIRYNREDKGIPEEERKPIIIYINSPGGNVCDGYGVIDAILYSETPVYTVNLAQADSMGLLIYLAGKKRYTMLHSEFLMHDGTTFSYGTSSKVKDRINFENQVEEATKQYVLGQTNIDEATYDEKMRVEWYFLPDEAKEIGVAHYIIGKDCKLSEIL